MRYTHCGYFNFHYFSVQTFGPTRVAHVSSGMQHEGKSWSLLRTGKDAHRARSLALSVRHPFERFRKFCTCADAVASASQARGPRFESRWDHSSFSLKSPDFVPVAPRVAFFGMGQARSEINLFIYL